MHAPDLLTQVDSLLARKEDRKLKNLLLAQDFHDIAHVIDRLVSGRRKLFAILPPEIQAEVIIGLAEHSKEFILPRLSDMTIARFLHFNDEDDAADILQYLRPERREKILENLKQDKRTKIEKLLLFDPETAGGLMDLNFIIVKPDFTLLDVAEKVRKHMENQKQAPLVVAADTRGKAIGFIPYKDLIVSPPSRKVESITHSLPLIGHRTDQESVLRMALQEKSDVFGVVDDEKRLLGVIHMKDLLRIAQMEATEDVYRFAGVSREERVLDSPLVAIRMRYHWLIINLATAFLAAFVVSLFEGTIAKMAILAAFMPIVAGEGGNAGTQTLAVVVRGLALGEFSPKHRWYIVLKETIAGLANGIINGIIVATVVWLWNGSLVIGLVLGMAMIINLIVAGIAGATIPIMLKALKIDPAIASTVFVTTATDVFGFLAFLGLATLVVK